jgi:hypothetical protein
LMSYLNHTLTPLYAPTYKRKRASRMSLVGTARARVRRSASLFLHPVQAAGLLSQERVHPSPYRL